MKYYVYAIYNSKHDRVYIGQTRDLEVRLDLHRNKTFANGYTAKFDGQWKIIYTETAENRKQALIREKQLKSYRGRQFIKQFIPG